MVIQIDNPELAAMLEQRMFDGHFPNLETMLLSSMRELEGRRRDVPPTERQLAEAREAAEEIARIQQRVRLERPEGMSWRDYAHVGHRFYDED